MTPIERVIAWARQQEPWLQDAVRRLLTQPALSLRDVDEILLMLKRAKGLEVDDCPTPIPIEDALPPSPAGEAPTVSLKSISSIRRVNALDGDQALRFDATGLNIVYGRNGAGKSGYARLLKRACRCRDSEPIVPNVLEARSEGVASANFVILVNGADTPVAWTDDSAGSPHLRRIRVFDARAARLYVNEANEVEFLPYGTQVFRQLGPLLRQLRERLQGESREPSKPIVEGVQPGTAAAALMDRIDSDLTRDQIVAFAVWTSEDSTELTQAERRLEEIRAGRPVDRIERLRSMVGRASALVAALEASEAAIGDATAQALRSSVESRAVLEKAARLESVSQFVNEPLRGVGSESWRLLWEAAARFSEAEAFPGATFPVTTANAPCVLCQQALSEVACERLTRFAAFVRGEAEARLRVADARVKELRSRVITFAPPSPSDWDDLLNALCQGSPEDRALVDAALAESSLRRDALLGFEGGSGPSETESRASRALEVVHSRKASTEREIARLTALPAEQETPQLERRIAELSSRRAIAKHRDSILDHLAARARRAALINCVSATDTTAMSIEGRRIVTESTTASLREALVAELRQVGLARLPVTFVVRAVEGQTRHYLKLGEHPLASGAKLGDILSEGEQRAIAFASFLAELTLDEERSAVVFDDPVSSLDHVFRRRVARRLAEEGVRRQVAVFTHDLVFAYATEEACDDLGVTCRFQAVERGPSGPGLVDDTERLNRKVVARLGLLKEGLQSARRKFDAGDQRGYETRAQIIYCRLRAAWERAVEEVLLRGAVERYDYGIETQKLSKVRVSEADVVRVTRAMTKCSRFVHDEASADVSPVPHPDEVQADLDDLSTFVAERRSS